MLYQHRQALTATWRSLHFLIFYACIIIQIMYNWCSNSLQEFHVGKQRNSVGYMESTCEIMSDTRHFSEHSWGMWKPFSRNNIHVSPCLCICVLTRCIVHVCFSTIKFLLMFVPLKIIPWSYSSVLQPTVQTEQSIQCLTCTVGKTCLGWLSEQLLFCWLIW